MGFNIAGLVINHNFKKDIPTLANALNWKLKIAETVTFAEASKNWLTDHINVYFGEKGTLIFFPHEWAMNKYHVKGHDSLCFAYSEETMAFLLSHMDANDNYRSFIEMEGKRNLEEGIELEMESTIEDASELIMVMIDKTLGENWQEVIPQTHCSRCIRLGFKTDDIEARHNQPESIKRRWWEFWK